MSFGGQKKKRGRENGVKWQTGKKDQRKLKLKAKNNEK
jgi:hypothetical protein